MDNLHVLKPSSALTLACLAFVGGFADASSFVGADGIFCAHVTGNFVVLAADLARGARADELLKLSTFPIFVVAVLAATALHLRLGSRAARSLLLASAGLFAVAALVAILHGREPSGPSKSVVVACLVVAMAFQNAIHRVTPSLGPMTTVMTGNVTGWLVEKILPIAPENVARHRTTGFVIAAFAAGCAAGAVGVRHVGFASSFVPMLLVLLVRSRLPANGT